LRSIRRDLDTTVLSGSVLDDIVANIMQGEEDPYTAGRKLYERFKIGS